MNYLNLTCQAAKIVQSSLDTGVLTISMNNPQKLNGWTFSMLSALKEAFARAEEDEASRVVILTGKGNYYCAGVNLSGALKLMHPKKLRASIQEYNQNLFETFLKFPKPILVAMNGPAIGASVTSATLCNGIIASENTTFSTPFAALGVPPEGCSSVHFPNLIGNENAQRMLGKEGWRPTAREAIEIGLIQWIASSDTLLEEANKIARDWVENKQKRSFLAGATQKELEAINAKESVALADAFLASTFLKGQAKFLWRKNKKVPSIMFWVIWGLRPLWARLL